MEQLFQKAIEQEVPKTTLFKHSQKKVKSLGAQTNDSMRTIAEFIDRGMKGLLSGDISVFLLPKIDEAIKKNLKEYKESLKVLE